MLKNLFKPKYRIKRKGHSLLNGGWTFRYLVEWKYLLWPFCWVGEYLSEGYSTLEEAQGVLKKYIWETYKKEYSTDYIHHTFSVPKHIPKEQELRYLVQKGKDEKMQV